jgi:hypothetical protein
MNFGILNGDAYGPGRTGASYKWEKISGPASYSLDTPDSLKTKVSNLEKGIYQFQLTATSNTRQTSTYIMTLKVQDATSSSKQILFWDLNWSCPFGCSIMLGDISLYRPAGSNYDIYIRRGFFQTGRLLSLTPHLQTPGMSIRFGMERLQFLTILIPMQLIILK